MILLGDLATALDTFFSLCDWEADPAMRTILPNAYASIGYDYAAAFEADFCARFNGLMLRSAEAVRHVYCASFPTPDVLEALLAATSGGALLFLHHPVDMEVLGVGFLPIPPDVLERLRSQGVSVYACHAPLDCHEEIGTAASMVQALGVRVDQRFIPYGGGGYAGRIGVVDPIGLDDLVARGREVFGVERVEIGGARPGLVERIAVVPGGGNDPGYMAEAEEGGAQVYVCGTWDTMTTPPGEGIREWAEANRRACRAYAATTSMALLGFSHPATEFLVMKAQLAGWFADRGLPVICLPQENWWR